MKARYILPIVLAAILGIAYLNAINLTGPQWDNSVPFTNDSLNCSWTNSIDTDAINITIYKGLTTPPTTVWNTTWLNASAGDTLVEWVEVNSVHTTKLEYWMCDVTLYNTSGNTDTDNDIVRIGNSPPTTEGVSAGIFNSSEDIGFNSSLLEDTTVSIDVNATDNDGDSLTYLQVSIDPEATFCTRDVGGSTTGLYTCAPEQSDLTNNAITLYNVTFTVTDGQNVGGRTVSIRVIPSNDAPQVSVSNQTTFANTSKNYTFSVSDEENQRMILALIFNSSNSEIQNTMSIQGLNSDNSSVSIYYDANLRDVNDVGVWPIWVNVTDTESSSNVSLYYFNISAVGTKPYFVNISPHYPVYNLTEDVNFIINITANDTDVNQTIGFYTSPQDRFNVTVLDNTTNTSFARAYINWTPDNDDVGIYTVTLYIVDQEGLTNSTTLNFNVTNVNDVPEIFENSTYPENTQGNANASNLTAYSNTPFAFRINATDIDVGDSLTYASNSSLFTINDTTGLISFTPSDQNVSGTPYSINVTVTDGEGATANRTIMLWVLANTAPRFDFIPPYTINKTADFLFFYNLSNRTLDNEGSVVNFTILFNSTSLYNFDYNTTTGLINFTPNKSQVGNYSFTLRIADNNGATNSTLFNVSINNSPVAPIWRSFLFNSSTFVETKTLTYQMSARDDDLFVPIITERLIFTTNLSLPYSLTNNISTNNVSSVYLSITPPEGSQGNYSVWFNVTDIYNNTDTEIIKFEVFDNVLPPNITNITPFGKSPGYFINETYNRTAFFLQNRTNITFSEGRNVTFGVIVNDSRPLNYTWKLDGTRINGTDGGYESVYIKNTSYEFDYFSSGFHVLELNVSNDRYEHSLFRWNITVANVNRAPIQIEALSNITVDLAYTDDWYFIRGTTTRFIDPDDDDNGNSVVFNGTGYDVGEENTLNFSMIDSCPFASVSITGPNITVVGLDEGVCYVRFNATDGFTSITSNNISINVTNVTEGAAETQTTVSTGGGGGQSSRNNYIPILKQDVKPQAFSLIAPKMVTVYENNSLNIPIIINNTWSSSLNLVQIDVEANESGVEVSLDQDFFEEIPANQSREITLSVRNYRLGENYEIKITGNVSDPEYDDDAIIILSSIEQASEGDQVNVKVTFANDLLNSNPECQELNEVLNQAKEQLAGGNVDQARLLVDNVVMGCKYLVQTKQRVEEQPYRVNPVIDLENVTWLTVMFSLLAFVVILSVAMLIYYHYTRSKEEDI